jgi:hypothetical protein
MWGEGGTKAGRKKSEECSKIFLRGGVDASIAEPN